MPEKPPVPAGDPESVLPLAEEYIEVGKRGVERARVRVEKTVRSHMEPVELTLQHDEVEIERVPVGRAIETHPELRYEGETLVIPVVEEVLVTRKQLVLKEELHVRRRVVAERHTESVLLRAEELSVRRDKAQTRSSTVDSANRSVHMAKTVVALMENSQEAQSVVEELVQDCGCRREDIGLMARGENETVAGRERAIESQDDETVTSGALKGAGAGAAVGGVLGLVAGAASLAIPGIGPIIAAGPIAAALAGMGIGAAAGGIIGGLTHMGVPEDEAHYYAEGVKRGGTLITVNAATDDAAQCAAQVMHRHGAADIEERASQWRQEGWSGRLEAHPPLGAERASQSTREQVLPVAKEELVVGKREVDQGRVRVYSRVTETPVEQTVQLREEHVDIERRPVDREVAAGDDAFRERSVEVRETAEEPVVAKRSRITEEVRVGKQADVREETVRDTVRQTEVEVDQQGARTGGTRATSPYRGPERRKSNLGYSGAERRMALH